MKLSDHDLQQINSDWLRERTPEELLHVSQNLLNDLKEARERLNQNSTNSSVPSGSQPPWFHPSQDSDNEDEDDDDDDTPIPLPPSDDKEDSGRPAEDKADSRSDKKQKTSKPSKEQRNPGKQPGAQGFGHTQVLPMTAIEDHRACHCAGCGKAFTSETASRAYTGFYTVDIECFDTSTSSVHRSAQHKYGEPDKPGIRVNNTLHRYYDTTCACAEPVEANAATPPASPRTGNRRRNCDALSLSKCSTASN